MTDVSLHLKTVTELPVAAFMQKYLRRGSYRLILLYWVLAAPNKTITENGIAVRLCKLTRAHVAAILDLRLIKNKTFDDTPAGIEERNYYVSDTVSRHFKNFIDEGILIPRGSRGVYEVNTTTLLAAIAAEEAKFLKIIDDDGQPKSRAEYMRNRRKKLKSRRKA